MGEKKSMDQKPCDSPRRSASIAGAGVMFITLLSGSVFGSVGDDFRFETSAFMKGSAYRRPDHLAPDVGPDGAEGKVNIAWDLTHTGKWFIEEQRHGSDAIAGGIAKEDPAAIDRGLKILRWGFRQQQPEGSFACSDTFHSTSFFIEASAHACLLLSESPFAARYAQDVNWIAAHLLKAALWMTKPSVETEGRRSNQPYAHRRYLVAAALGETGVLTGNRFLVDHSALYIQEGISLQDPSGFNPEKGGYDCSYHAVGLLYAERYYDIVADGELKNELFGMLKKGAAWLASRVQSDGTIDPSGNTRTGLGQESGRSGTLKTINYGSAYSSLYHWSLISGDPAFGSLAETVFNGETIYKHQISK
jgi:hypothetical protein